MSQAKYRYSVCIMQHNETEETASEIVDKWISADDAINLMQHINENVEEESYTFEESFAGGVAEEEESSDDGEESEEADEEEVEEEEPAPSRGRQASWDKDEAKRLINEGKKAGDIAEEVGASIGSIYQLKSDMKKDGELVIKVDPQKMKEAKVDVEVKPIDRDPLTPKKPEPKVSIDPDEDPKIKQKKAMFRRLKPEEKDVIKEFQGGLGVAGLFDKFPSVSVQRINDLIQAYGTLDLE